MAFFRPLNNIHEFGRMLYANLVRDHEIFLQDSSVLSVMVRQISTYKLRVL